MYVLHHDRNIKSDPIDIASGFESCIKFVLGQNKSLQIMIASKLRKWICMDHLIVNMEMSGSGNLVLNMNITETSDCLLQVLAGLKTCYFVPDFEF